MRLFCFPHAGGGAAAFHAWQEELPAFVEVCPVELPGRWTRRREAPFRRLAPLVDAAARGLAPWLDRPFAFFGHSVGGLIAWELARHLRRAGGPEPRALFVAARRPPMGELLGHAPLHALDDEAFLRELARIYDGIPPAVRDNAELLELTLPMLRADVELLETYEHVVEPPLDCAITALGGRADRSTDEAALAQWRALTRGEFALRMFDGGHFFVDEQRRPLLRTLGRALRRL